MPAYDATSPESIFAFSRGLIGKSLFEAATLLNPEIKREELVFNGKGGLGQLVEKFYYGYEPNSSPTADFEKAGVELKTTPLKETGGQLTIKERLVCDMIDFCAIVDVPFEDSLFYKKCLLMLILFYLHQKDIEKCDLRFLFSVLWKLQGKDLQIIKHDYETIVGKIRAGKAHELSEGDTLYLGACRKGQKGDSLRKQPYNAVDAPKRAFSLKPSYMRTILQYVMTSGCSMVTNTKIKIPDTELVTSQQLKTESFEQVITKRLMKFKGKDYKQIARNFNVKISPAEKSRYEHATRIILHEGISSINDAEEIKKAGIIFKTIRVQKNGRIKESMSFKNISYREMLETSSFYDSEWYEIITSRFLFVIYREEDVPSLQKKKWQDEKRYVLDRVIFWTMPESDMKTAEDYWKNIKKNVAADFHYTDQDNTFWKLGNHNKFHVRPKGQNAADLQISPVSGREVRKTCYWFNAEYIQHILKKAYASEWQTTFHE